MKWLCDLWRGKKQVNEEKTAAVAPHIKALRVNDLIRLAEEEDLRAYLPSSSKNGQLPKIQCTWLVSVSVIG